MVRMTRLIKHRTYVIKNHPGYADFTAELLKVVDAVDSRGPLAIMNDERGWLHVVATSCLVTPEKVCAHCGAPLFFEAQEFCQDGYGSGNECWDAYHATEMEWTVLGIEPGT